MEEKQKNINEWINIVHNLAKEKGWWQETREPGTLHMLMVSEIAEATEEVRKNMPPIYKSALNHKDKEGNIYLYSKAFYEPQHKEFHLCKNPIKGEAIELVDCLIRILDYFGYKKWDLEKILNLKHEYNETRSFKHGGKKF